MQFSTDGTVSVRVSDVKDALLIIALTWVIEAEADLLGTWLLPRATRLSARMCGRSVD